MKCFCVYTPSVKNSSAAANKVVETGKKFGVNVQKFESVNPRNLHSKVSEHQLKLRYTPVPSSKTDFEARKAPEKRICNGMTHYMLYLKCVEYDEPIMILEHDTYFVGVPPSEGIYDGVIQISSHNTHQVDAKKMKSCVRANKMFKFQPDYEYDDNWDKNAGVFKHPLTGTNGTSGYIIGPGAALKMIEYIRKDGIAFADRIRTEHIGEENLYIQYPFSVFCSQKI
jgi:GR25 family glycosyltransferase involved in LPS biosynthesis